MKRKIVYFLLIGLAVPMLLHAESGLSARQIMDKVYYRPEGNDRKSDLTMTLTNARGDQRVREIAQFTKDMGSIEKSIMFFRYPADVKDTSFMNWSYDEAGREDDQWIYLPALKKVKRISSDSKSDYFMGSDFTYDDLGDRHPSKDTHKMAGTEMVNGERCYVIESTPLETPYQYSRVTSWVVDHKWIAIKKEFYDEDGDLLKTLSVKEIKNIDGFWVILHSQMHNIQKNHTTDMRLKNVVINGGINDSWFSERYMRRGIQ